MKNEIVLLFLPCPSVGNDMAQRKINTEFSNFVIEFKKFSFESKNIENSKNDKPEKVLVVSGNIGNNSINPKKEIKKQNFLNQSINILLLPPT